jgi:hypothetical protein
LFVTEACALLDLIDADSSIVSLASSRLGQILIPDVVLSTVGSLDEAECSRLGVQVCECEVERLERATDSRQGLSFEDRVCLLIAREEGWTILTHERVVRAACDADGIASACAFDLVRLLQEGGHITPTWAVSVASNLREVNPRCLSEELFDGYARQIGTVPGQSRKSYRQRRP